MTQIKQPLPLGFGPHYPAVKPLPARERGTDHGHPPDHPRLRRVAADPARRSARDPGGGLPTPDNVATQRAAIEAATGPVLAYCASGNRCSVVWALAEAGRRPVDELIGLPARFGYQLEHLRPQIAALTAAR